MTRPPHTAVRRGAWSSLLLVALAVLVAARAVTPAASGRGTHLALGLPPCGFLVWTGLPCPTCGLTTAFSQLAHGHVVASVRAHPLGVPLFVITVGLVPLALVGAVRAHSLAKTIEDVHADRWAVLLVLSLFATWLARLAGSVL